MALFILKYIFIASVFALYIIKVYVITFFKKSYACNFLKVASV